jgi:transposase
LPGYLPSGRYPVCDLWCLFVLLFLFWNGPYGEPIRDVGHREHEGAGRPSIDRGLRARARYMAAPRDFHLCEFDRLGEDLQVIERDLARSALADEGVKRLMTIPGVDMTVALAMKAAIGDVSRFDEPQKLVSYLGLNPSVRQSGPGPAYHGRITKQGRGHARGMLVEAAWAAARAPGPLRAFFLRVRARRGQHVAAVATARKLAVVIWHLLTKGESYAWARPSLHAKKLRDVELKAGSKAVRGQKGAAHAYNIKSHREEERRWVEQAEGAYARFVAGWNPRAPRKARTDAANEVPR